MEPDAGIDDVSDEDYDALVIPGGYASDKVRRDDHVLESGERSGGTPAVMSGTLLWIIAAILVVVGVVQIVQGQLILGIVLIVAGLLVGPGGVSIFGSGRTGH